MKKTQAQQNWFLVLMGLFFLACYFVPGNENINEDELVTKTLVAHNNIKNVHYHKSKVAYRFNADSFACSFIIKTPGSMAGQGHNLDSIHKGDTLLVKIHNSRLADLSNKLEDVPIYDLQKNRQQLYTLNAYNQEQQNYDRRWHIILICMAVLFILRGTSLITSKVAWLLAIVTFLAILTARFFYTGW